MWLIEMSPVLSTSLRWKLHCEMKDRFLEILYTYHQRTCHWATWIAIVTTKLTKREKEQETEKYPNKNNKQNQKEFQILSSYE